MSLSCPRLFLYVLFFSFLVSHNCSASDCLEDGSLIRDGSSQSTLLSPSQVFELGFFTPDGSFNRNRYLGIWYYHSNPRIVVWVANREKPVLGNNGYVIVKGGKVEVLDTDDSTYWTADSVASVNLTKLCLNDNGNLILSSDLHESILWQSFDHPTDTILPGMIVKGNFNMKSWKDNSNPETGSSTLLLQPGRDFKITVEEKYYPQYWDSRTDPSAKIPSSLSEVLSDGDSKTYLLNNTRLVMNFTGQIQLWKWESKSGWSLDWQEPQDRCSFNSVCGNFGSCNSHSGLPCKCLPGFKPSSLQEWNTGCFSGGCVPEPENPCQRKDTFLNDTFLRLPMMKVGDKECSASAATVENCKTQCLQDCNCVAYAIGAANCSGGEPTPTDEKSCLTWSNQVSHLKEEDSQGLTLFVRIPSSDLGSSSRICKPCGAYVIPYPLSTGESCGDSLYSKLQCNPETGQVNFSTSTGTFRVSLIDPDAKQFSIQVMHADSCDSGYINKFVLSPKLSFPFFVMNCTIFKDKPLIQLGQPFIEVEIGWKPPPEPTCSVSSDCVAWPRTTCKAAKGHTRRCMCRSNFHWDGSKLNCIRVPFPLKALVSCIAVALAIIVLCGVYFVYHKREGRIAEKQDSFKFKGDDDEGVDVPIFSWGSILSATNNFSDATMLGTGGFGSVYRGRLPDEKDIAVKRLSSVSMQGVEEFRTEVVLIAKLQHRNLVRLLGYCVKEDENILVYEYMHSGSLDSYLFDQIFSVYLDWKKRYDIILGIARGLVYLHQDSRLRIIHRDLKPSNILLDEELNPKIADFGLARIFGGKQTVANTDKIVGTHGYMSPEYACEGYFSIKSDVFSFGVVVLETISGRRNSRTTVFEQGLNLLGHAWRLWSEDKGLEFIDPTLKESCNQTEVLKCIYLGLLCVQDDPVDRPTMPNVVLMLSSSNESTADQSVPKKPSFFCSSSSGETASSSSLGGFSSFCNAITVSTVGR